MNHHNINAIVYYLIVFIRYVLPITLVFIGIGRWSYAKSINNPEKQIMGVNFALKSILFLYIVTFIPIFIIYGLAMISKGGTHSGDFSMISFCRSLYPNRNSRGWDITCIWFHTRIHISLSMVDYRR